MKLVLSQLFPMGRFHATPWKAFPYDDPYGEWPPSPWRLIRAMLARSHQMEREGHKINDTCRGELVRAFASSQMSWHLPNYTWRGTGIRQYQPVDFEWKPKDYKKKKVRAFKGYNTTKAQDNFWLTAGESQPLYWILDGANWSDSTLALLDQCLARMTYFGRAESITAIERVSDVALPDNPNCFLTVSRTSESVPVLCPKSDVTLGQLQLTTDNKEVRNSTMPPGAIWRFAQRPSRPAVRSQRKPIKPVYNPTRILQFAIGSRVAPTLDHIALIANWFRGRAVRYFLEHNCGLPKGDWRVADDLQKDAVSLLSGKGSEGKKLLGHEHAYFGLFLDPETKKPTRLIAWKTRPFTPAEEEAIRHAASEPFSLGHREKSANGQKATGRDPWKVHCIPLDSAVPPPSGFNPDHSFAVWESLTPYVPPRHAFDRRGKAKPGETPPKQLQRDLKRWGLEPISISQLNNENRPYLEGDPEGEWVKVHVPKRPTSGPTNNSKRGFRFRLTFPTPVSGPIALGHSSHFGLGLFVPIDPGAAS